MKYWWVLLVVLVCMVPLLFLGYGSDNDTYGVLQSGYSTWHLHVLSTSRDPGYWTYEAVAYFLSSLGGYVLSNLMSFAVTGVILWRFYRFAQELNVAYPMLWMSCLIVAPVYMIASTTTIDYVWSLLCIVLASEFLLAERLVAATILAALAISFRAANIVVVGGGIAALIGYEFYTRRKLTSSSVKLAVCGLASAALGCVTYIASYRLAGDSWKFMAPMIGPATMWTLKMQVGRFVYKGFYAFGPIAMVILAAVIVQYARRRRRGKTVELDASFTRTITLFWGFVIANLLLFFKFPIEISYLIPAIFFFLLIAGSTFFQRSFSWTVALLVSILSLNFLLPSFAQPNIPGRSTTAHLHFAWEPGMLIEDVRSRRQYLGCKDAACYVQHQNLSLR